MFKKSDYSKELKKHGVELDRTKPDDRKVEIDTSRKVPSHDSAKPDQGPDRQSTKR